MLLENHSSTLILLDFHHFLLRMEPDFLLLSTELLRRFCSPEAIRTAASSSNFAISEKVIYHGVLPIKLLNIDNFNLFTYVLFSQLPGRLFSPSDDISKKLSLHFLLHFPVGMGSYDHHAKYQGVFPDLL